ncbi:hypothetical protein DFH08DRAFT_866172 [Mycena albidolilacea]|uniref:Uncharacterized protein n=1 Tax=Mycena albidolilacea TaxID=1033008 RepID=A0AAD7ERL7_9AGAR|nr:hypothetical protein DFH08DRAFT_866172 [Mycena albidolilacea]
MSLFKLPAAWRAVICCLPALVHGYPTNWAFLHCPSNSLDGLPTPTYGSDQIVFTVCVELNISAPLIDVYNTILDFQGYPSWNTFVFAVDLPSNVTTTPMDNYVSMPMTFHTAGVLPPFNTTSNEVLTVLDYANAAGYSLSAWRYDDGLGGVGMRAEHPNILVDVGGGVTRYLSFETYYVGTETAVVLPLKGNLQTAFEKQGADLKAYVEGTPS